jgi:hypothetical protein
MTDNEAKFTVRTDSFYEASRIGAHRFTHLYYMHIIMINENTPLFTK